MTTKKKLNYCGKCKKEMMPSTALMLRKGTNMQVCYDGDTVQTVKVDPCQGMARFAVSGACKPFRIWSCPKCDASKVVAKRDYALWDELARTAEDG